MKEKIQKLKDAIGEKEFEKMSAKNREFMIEIAEIEGIHLVAIAEYINSCCRDMKPFKRFKF